MRVREQLLDRSILAFNLHSRLRLASNLDQLVLRNRGTLHVHGAVLRLLGALQHADNSLADVFQEGGAVLIVSPIEDARRAALEVGPDADLEAPVEEEAVVDQCVADLGGLLLEVVLGDALAFEDG